MVPEEVLDEELSIAFSLVWCVLKLLDKLRINEEVIGLRIYLQQMDTI